MHTFFPELIFLPFIGFFMGILSMLYGIGGGVIITPIAYLFLRRLGFASDTAMHIAIGTSMLCVLGNTISASYSHYRQGNILWNSIKPLIPFVILGALAGVLLAHILSGLALKNVFIVFLLIILVHSLVNKNFKYPWKINDYKTPTRLSSNLAGLIIGTVSVLVGIGGGTLIVPYLRYYKMPLLNATAAATTITPLLALTGSIGYLLTPLVKTPPYTVGSINLPIFACVFIGSWFGVQFARKISPQFNEIWRARSFPILIAGIIILMLFA